MAYVNSERTSKAILEMLQDGNIDKNLVDSGILGYGYASNQRRNLAAEPASRLEVNQWGMEWTHSGYHWLNEVLDYSDDAIRLERLFNFFADFPENQDTNWFVLIKEFVDEFLPECGVEVGGIEGLDCPITEYTYNNQHMLDQDFQYTAFSIDDIDYALIRIHNGADARWGFTTPRLFQLNSDFAIYDTDRGNMYCPQCETNWHTDDGGYSIYADNYNKPDLPYKWEYEPVDPESTLGKFLVAMWRLDGEVELDNIKQVYGDENFVFQSPGGVVCPHCGKGVLSAWFS